MPELRIIIGPDFHSMRGYKLVGPHDHSKTNVKYSGKGKIQIKKSDDTIAQN
jgi:hypothetical protein